MNRRILILGALALLAPAAAPAQEPVRIPLIPGADPRAWEPYFDLGVQKFAKFPREAAVAFEWSAKLDPTRAEPLYGRWAAFLLTLKLEELSAYLRGEEVTRTKPAVQAADSLRALALVRNPFVHRGLDAHVLDRFPGRFSDARDTRAWLHYSNGEFLKAIELHTRSIEQNVPNAVWRRYDRALAYVGMGNYKGALDDLRLVHEEMLKEEQGENVGLAYRSKHFILYMIGRLYVEMREYAAARTAFGQALVEDAGFAYGHAGLATVSRIQRQHEQAESEFGLALELAPNDGVVRYLHAQVLFDLSRFGGAADEAAKAAEIEPEWAAPLLLAGRSRERQGREEEAFAHYARYVALAPANDSQAKALKLRLDLRAKRAP